MTKKQRGQFFPVKLVTPSVAAPVDTNLSDATVRMVRMSLNINLKTLGVNGVEPPRLPPPLLSSRERSMQPYIYIVYTQTAFSFPIRGR